MAEKLILKDGSVMRYVKFGTGEKVFLMLPGASIKYVTDNAEAVAQAYSMFSEEYTTYLFDQKDPIEDDYDVWKMADVIAEAAEMLGIRHADCFGASLGGMMLQCLAIEHSELVDKAVLGSTLSRKTPYSVATFKRWDDACDRGDIDLLSSDFVDMMYTKETCDALVGFKAVLSEGVTAEMLMKFKKIMKIATEFDCYDRLNEIKCPVLTIGAGHDTVLGLEGIQAITEKLGCETHIYEDYYHAVYDEAPDYKDRILAFFRS